MIFVILGSQKNQFNRLLKSLDRLIEAGEIEEPLFAQTGYSDYEPQHYAFRKFLDHEDFEKIESRADLVITHGGTGAIMGALKKGKKVIAVPRRYDLGEHNDDHQIQVVSELSAEGLITCCEDTDRLGVIIREMCGKDSGVRMEGYASHTSVYLEEIGAYIESLCDTEA